LLLFDPNPTEQNQHSIYLRYAFFLLGSECPVFPGMILDDWGGEITGIKMYRWIRENGDSFPRAEIFGLNQAGESEQYFVRELDLTLKIRCYAYPDKAAALESGKVIQNVLLPNEDAKFIIKRRRPANIKRPINGTRVNFWEVPPLLDEFDFQMLDLEV
jgi:hypothetical protein